jgi:hypothetical protein
VWTTFTWTNFGGATGDRLSVDNAFDTGSGVWRPSLTSEETLVVVQPDGYGVKSAPTGSQTGPASLSEGVTRWEGPQDFGERGPWIVYSGDAPTPTQSPTDPPPNGSETPGLGPSPGGPDGDGPLSGALPLVVFIVVAAASAAVLAVYMRGDDDGLGALVGSDDRSDGGSSAESGSGSAPEAGTGSEANATGASAAGNGSEPRDGVAASAGAAAAGVGADGGREPDEESSGGGAAADDGPIDEELLSDEERVERLIERNGGRMKQAAIVRETGWSNAKVSQLLSAMDEDDRIDKLRIGRENLISFPDEDITDFDE